MLIQINTDHNIEGHEALAADTRGVVEAALSRFREHITRVEVHLTDENGPKDGGVTKKAVMEARLAGLQPLAVTSHAATLDLAVSEAADKLVRLIESTRGRLRDHDKHQAGSSTDEPGSG